MPKLEVGRREISRVQKNVYACVCKNSKIFDSQRYSRREISLPLAALCVIVYYRNIYARFARTWMYACVHMCACKRTEREGVTKGTRRTRMYQEEAKTARRLNGRVSVARYDNSARTQSFRLHGSRFTFRSLVRSFIHILHSSTT